MPTDPRITITIDATTARALLAALTEAVAALDGTTQHHRDTIRTPIGWPNCPTCGTDLQREAVTTADSPFAQQVPGPWICPEGHAVPHL